jgi:hypothetical protein
VTPNQAAILDLLQEARQELAVDGNEDLVERITQVLELPPPTPRPRRAWAVDITMDADSRQLLSAQAEGLLAALQADDLTDLELSHSTVADCVTMVLSVDTDRANGRVCRDELAEWAAVQDACGYR